ncbi:MAG: quinone-dependent dihydroorotate dehydrogenase [Candidatus Gracilibacteria bacterium]|jgi:dihydroorotate dehydrogenase
MKTSFIKIRNAVIHFFYLHLLKPIFFAMDPEFVHDLFTLFGRILGSNPFTRILNRLAFDYQDKILEQDILGIHFRNPIGLAAGFDKDALLTKIIPCVGFGFEEIGSISGEKCAGNEQRPRLWRHPELKSLRIYYGLKNDGADSISARLTRKKFAIPIGTSIVKTNCALTVDTEEGIKDYIKAFKAFARIGSYFTINLSCPNAFGGQPFTDATRLDSLLRQIDRISTKKPIFLKLSPDLTELEVDAIISVAKKHKINGFICTNLTKKHSFGQGGLSGKAVDELSLKQIEYIHRKTNKTGGIFANKLIIIACGGIFTAKDAYKRIRAGASLLQLITSMIYEGPQNVSEINRGLAKLLKENGFKSIKEAIGKPQNTLFD